MKQIVHPAVAAIIAVAALLLLGCSSDGASNADQSESSAQSQDQATAASQAGALTVMAEPEGPIAIAADQPQVFEGLGNTRTFHFDITDGILYMTAEHQGDADFAVQVLTDRHLESQSATGGLHSGTGSPRGAVVSIETTGVYSGVRAHPVSPAQLFGLTPGTYLMQVTADGTWRVELTQPVWDSGGSPPFNWSGSGDDVKGPISLETGTRSVHITHGGTANFVVELVTADGTTSEKLVNVTGVYDGSVDVKIHPIIGLTPDIYGMIVTADGEWTVDFSE